MVNRMSKLKGCMQVSGSMGDFDENAGQYLENLGMGRTYRCDVKAETCKEMTDERNRRIKIKDTPRGLSTDRFCLRWAPPSHPKRGPDPHFRTIGSESCLSTRGPHVGPTQPSQSSPGPAPAPGSPLFPEGLALPG